MQKVARFIGFGALAAIGTAFLFNVINLLTVLGTIFNGFSVNAGLAIVVLLDWLVCAAGAALIIVLVVIEILKMIPIFAGKDVENRSLFQMNGVCVVYGATLFISAIFGIIILAIQNGREFGGIITSMIFASIVCGAALVSFIGKNLPALVRVILNLAAQFFALVIVFMGIDAGGLTTVFYVFLMLGLFAGSAYVVLANLDAFKAKK